MKHRLCISFSDCHCNKETIICTLMHGTSKDKLIKLEYIICIILINRFLSHLQCKHGPAGQLIQFAGKVSGGWSLYACVEDFYLSSFPSYLPMSH